MRILLAGNAEQCSLFEKLDGTAARHALPSYECTMFGRGRHLVVMISDAAGNVWEDAGDPAAIAEHFERWASMVSPALSPET